MKEGSESPVTRLLHAVGGGDAAAASQLLPMVYEQLRQLARQRMAGERDGHTLQATALVHEAYLRVVGPAESDGQAAGGGAFPSRSHFFFAAAEAMRRILIDHARARGGPKRGGKRQRIQLDNVLDLGSEENLEDSLALDEAISRLEKESASVAAVVRLRFFAGLSIDETAEALGVSPRTVKREWTYARAWLFEQLGGEAG